MNLLNPGSMDRRHFLRHLAAGSAATVPAFGFLNHLTAHADEVRRNEKACILVWLGGGPPTIDMWDLKPGSKNGGEFNPISTKGDLQISEHLPKIAQQMDSLSVVRSMSTREADHTRGRYYMQTAYVPNPTVTHPSFGSVVSHELAPKRKYLEIPAFVSVGGGAGSSGFLGMTHAPFVVNSNGQIRNVNNGGSDRRRLEQRLAMWNVIEDGFIKSDRGELPQAHKDVYGKAVNLMTSTQMEAFQVNKEDPKVVEAYGNNNFGRGMLMARRLVEKGVPFVEVNLGGWDLHNDVFNTLRDQRLPMLDTGIAALTADLKSRGMLENTVILCMGEFGRTPRINQNVGRDHWASSWSLLLGGGGLNSGVAVGQTDKDGISIEGKSYLPGDIWATVAKAMGIPLNIVHTSKRGRPMKIANGGTPIQELIG
ncbi:MAG: DUF1501 domain-containing protein [Rubinisphaera brasiliensis]|uniref:DUF1501 domain-containing protein n=1 Tax=Rubinisphaera brasiliensis (strain ATCC 49424 / DSM 5305 / JCM 21570 / IAM 15109 / NBRC 103401 / IFAM 1448) TaxID=756272 RepID=F0SQB7_RUBBR|nr:MULTISPECIES: DUF1501 domain-containing protein [Rubinisphaera]ADY62296.1 protein of unknown function DUF1501 [Rubinisphaera brasiliensis DSM 5305]MBB01138.1 DUF1501 domain-containing protein [Planctomyces sp.]